MISKLLVFLCVLNLAAWLGLDRLLRRGNAHPAWRIALGLFLLFETGCLWLYYAPQFFPFWGRPGGILNKGPWSLLYIWNLLVLPLVVAGIVVQLACEGIGDAIRRPAPIRDPARPGTFPRPHPAPFLRVAGAALGPAASLGLTAAALRQLEGFRVRRVPPPPPRPSPGARRPEDRPRERPPRRPVHRGADPRRRHPRGERPRRRPRPLHRRPHQLFHFRPAAGHRRPPGDAEPVRHLADRGEPRLDRGPRGVPRPDPRLRPPLPPGRGGRPGDRGPARPAPGRAMGVHQPRPQRLPRRHRGNRPRPGAPQPPFPRAARRLPDPPGPPPPRLRHGGRRRNPPHPLRPHPRGPDHVHTGKRGSVPWPSAIGPGSTQRGTAASSSPTAPGAGSPSG